MTTTVPKLYDAIQQINAGIKGIKYAPNSASVPTQLTMDRLPAAIAFYGVDDWSKFGNMHFEIDVFVAPVGSGSPTTAMQTALTIADAFRQAYRPLSKILDVPIARGKWTGAMGFGTTGVHKTIGYAGTEYFGFCFYLPLLGIDA